MAVAMQGIRCIGNNSAPMGGFHGDSARAWLLQIVRHTCYSWLKENRPVQKVALDDIDDAWQEIAAPATDEPHSMRAPAA